MKILNSLLPITLASLLLTACDKAGNNGPSNESEVISLVTLAVQDSATQALTEFRYSDPDGDGGQAPTIGTIQLQAGHTYFCEIGVADNTQPDTTLDLTGEIRDEATAHQFFYTPTPDYLRVAYTPADTDANGIYIGFYTRWQAVTAGEGRLRVVLKHQPGLKPSTPKPYGDQSRGETDLQIDFPYRVE